MAETASNLAEFTVSELSASLKRTVEDAFGHVRLRGEISGFRGVHSSGHCYFALKDDSAKIDAVCWRGTYSKLRHKPEEGLEVVVTGRITTYANRSSYQIVVDSLEPAGAGALMALLEERKKKLAAEGLFAPERKRELPWLPEVVGVITSPTGSVIRDILHRLADRFPRRVLVWPVRVQGEASAGEVAAAIAGFNALEKGGAIPRPDILIVARGGGSIEELWGFNEEIVVRAAAGSTIPLISAVGHETDWTLIDMAADVRAPTPTAAAEMAVPVRAELQATADGLSSRLRRALLRQLETQRAALRSAARALPRPVDILAQARQRFDTATTGLNQGLRANIHVKRLAMTRLEARITPAALVERIRRETRHVNETGARLARAMPRVLAHQRSRLTASAKLLKSLSYQGVLERGFAVVKDAETRLVRSAGALSPGMALDIEFADGSVPAVAGAASAPSAPHKAQQKAPPKPARKPGGQGSLF